MEASTPHPLAAEPPVDTSGLYRDITGFAQDAPGWLQQFFEVWTDAGILLFGVLFVAAWWRARRAEPTALALAVLAPLATAVAYVVSESLKSVVDEERPCRAVAGAAPSLAECPPYGDWSFPSNHATIAGASAVALALVWRGMGWLTVPLALLMAFSRVFVGVHYPFDVAVGLVLGGLVVFLVIRLLPPPVTRLVTAMRASEHPAVRWCVGTGPAAHAYPQGTRV
ncbi:phosphatase PAP2 family protein [Streptomyces sp. KLOTTS4A1]|uniref:phosphatase PAP2 family protein n=1 Tax=Streptomyces sp. KLOTTS4A1 TaxID=3390996 RepID=UPI0039F48B96